MNSLAKAWLLLVLVALLAACAKNAPKATQPVNNPNAAGLSVPIASFVIKPNPPSGVNFTLEGCRNNGGITFPPSGPFVCPDAAYTTGNLGKGWNELDLVPHRVTIDAGNSAPASSTYTFVVVLDAKNGGHPGYDVLSEPTLNAALSNAACSAAVVSDEGIANPGLGGIDESRYRLVTITNQPKNTTCVYDYYGRLALGSHLFPGSSLHANLALVDRDKNGQPLSPLQITTQGIGARDVSIPVKEILPQELDKTMAGSQGQDHIWDLTKEPSPATVSFGNTCDANEPTAKQVQIKITWERKPATLGNITVITKVYATNPAARVITVQVSDQIRSGTSVLDTATGSAVDVPANTTNYLVLTHTLTVPSGTSNLNDVATATYIDKITGVPVPGQTTATATADISLAAPTNSTATISDSESITGAGLTFSADAFSGASGSFAGYTAGTPTTGPVVWNSNTQPGSASVVFDKRVYVTTATSTSGSLSDTATLTASHGFTTSANANINVSADVRVSLTINKTIPNVLQAGETQTFNFAVKDSNGVVVDSPSITFGPGETTKSATVGNLAPGSYTVSETTASGWAPQGDQSVGINPVSGDLSTCSGKVTFNNQLQPALAKAKKVTVPAGNEGDWEMILTGPGTPAGGEKVKTNASGDATFTTVLQEGSYTITETLKTGFDQTGTSGDCSFSVKYPADGGRVFSCTITNTQRGKIIVKKVTDPSGSAQSFEFTPSYNGGAKFSLGDGQSNDSGLLAPGTYSVSEAVPAGWDLTSATCDDGSAVDAIGLGAGETVTCTFKNTQRGHLIVDKVTAPAGDPQSFNFTTGGSGYSGFSLTDAAAPNDQELKPGTYSVTETVPAGWALTSATCDNGNPVSAIVLGAGQTVKCTFTNTKNATVIVKKVMVGGTGSFSFSGTPSGSINTNGGTLSASVAPGEYVSTETVPAGWDLTGVVCDDANSTGDAAAAKATFRAEAGETVTCTFTNTKRGSITVVKNTVGGNGTFNYTSNFGVSALTTVGGTASQTATNLVPGSYSISESDPAPAFDFTSLQCTDPSGGTTIQGRTASIDLAPGENVKCTYTNTARGKILVKKITKPAGASTSFTFNTSGAGYSGFSLADGQTNDSGYLVPGTYTAKELVPLGWVLTGIGGSTDPNTPYNCTVTGSGGSSGVGDLNTQTVTVSLKPGDVVTCVFENTGQGVTRTQGFWATHPQLANIAWFGGTAFGHTFPGVASAVGDALLCARPIDTLGKLMGGFWSDISKKTTNAKRSSLDQARMQLLQQLLAAELNASAFGSVPSTGSFAAWESAYCGTDQNAIQTAQQQAASFNSAGDSGTFTPGTSADSKTARSIADRAFWDTLP